MTRRVWITAGLSALVSVGGFANAAIGNRNFTESAVNSDAAQVAPATATATTASGAPVFTARRVSGLITTSAGTAEVASRTAAVMASDQIGTAGAKDSCVLLHEGTRVLTSLNPSIPVLGASTQKLLTASAALTHIPENFQPVTQVRAVRPIVDGVIDGDLWLIGGGDPLLTTPVYAATKEVPGPMTKLGDLADKIAATGLTRVAGRLVVDDRRYDAVRLVPSWKSSYIARRDVGPISALGSDDGFTSDPDGGFAAAANPDIATGEKLVAMLADRGVTVDGVVERPGVTENPTTAARVAVAEIQGLSRNDLVAQMLTDSDNVTAEMLLKEVAYQVRGSAGSTAAGAQIALEALEAAGIDTAGVNIVDGSGLDRGNRLTCAVLVGILDRAATSGPNSPILTGLPIAGQSGTMRKRLDGDLTSGRLRAKTGTLNGVSGLAGVIETSSRRSIHFAIVVNTADDAVNPAAVADRVAEVVAAYPELQTTWVLP
jgi:serine-type D-Ala-D-Ala carboxypeptidase/endopeptidase (penicillin-binding protein 4)